MNLNQRKYNVEDKRYLNVGLSPLTCVLKSTTMQIAIKT